MGELMISDGLKCVSQSVSVIKKSTFARFAFILFNKRTFDANTSCDTLIETHREKIVARQEVVLGNFAESATQLSFRQRRK